MQILYSVSTYCFMFVFILHNECHPPPAILLDDAVEHTGKVDLRWQQLEVVAVVDTIIFIQSRCTR